MTQLFGEMRNGTWPNQHLELDLKKNPLNQTCETQNTLLFPGQSTFQKELNSKIDLQLKQEDQKYKNSTKQKSNTSMRKKSLCFITEINKLLSKNKIKTEFISRDGSFLQKSYFNVQGQKRKIHFRSQRSTYCPTKNKKQQVEVQQSQNFQRDFQQQNVHEVQLKNSDDLKNKSTQKNNYFHKNLKGKISIFDKLKKNLCLNAVTNEPNALEKSYHKLIIAEQSAEISNKNRPKQTLNVNEQKNSQKRRLGKFIENLQKPKIPKIEKNEKLAIKPSKELILKQEKGKLPFKTTKQENIKLGRNLKNLSEISLQRRNQFLSHEHQTIDDIHYEKLKENLKNKIANIYKTNQFSTQPKITTISQARSMAVSKNDKDSEKQDIKHRKIGRANTAITRTGLQYNLGRSYRKSSNDQVKKMVFLTGINNSVNNSTICQKNERLLIQELNSCKRDKIVRKLQQKYLSTPRFPNSLNISPQSSALLTPKKSRTCRTSQKPTMQSTRIAFKKMANKQIEIEKMKVKLFEMMIDCDQERIDNKKLTKGLNVFEDYCDDVDKGLKNISTEISQFLQKD